MKQNSKAVLALISLVNVRISWAAGQDHLDFVPYYICDVGTDTSQYISTDTKAMDADPQDLGLIEPADCIAYCQQEKTANAVVEASCCTHSRYYYTASGLWGADCALTKATTLLAKEDTWAEEAGEYVTFQAVVLTADGDDSLVTTDYSGVTGELGQPADWKLSTTWRDGYYCDVETTDYEYIAEPDSYWTGLQSREACLEFCYRNMDEYGATCCGQAWLYQYATDVTQAYCALYISSGFRLMSVEETSTYVLFYSGIELNTDVQKNLDNIEGTLSDYLKEITDGFDTEDLESITGEAIDLDTIELGEIEIDFGNNSNTLSLSLYLTISSILAVMMLN